MIFFGFEHEVIRCLLVFHHHPFLWLFDGFGCDGEDLGEKEGVEECGEKIELRVFIYGICFCMYMNIVISNWKKEWQQVTTNKRSCGVR